MRFDEDNVIVSRCFERDDGEVQLSFHKPQPYSKPEFEHNFDGPSWRCFYTIAFPDGTTVHRYAVGIDSMQSLLLAFAAAMGDLRYVGNGTPERRPVLRWLGQDDLGLTINHFE